MAVLEIIDRTDRLFGRAADLGRLRDRARRTGLTVVVGPPQIGKSWLLMELAHRLVEEADPPFCVGLTRSPRGANDPLLQVVSELYQRWLADARAWEQVKATWEQQRYRLLPNFVKFVGKLSEKAAKLVPGGGELMGLAVKESLDGLVAASEDLSTGRLIVSRLEYSQAQELVRSVHQCAGRPIALLMDQWEETRSLDAQANTFRDFLREPEHWPGCHIFLGVRERSDAAAMLDGLEREYPGTASIYKLGEMDLSAEAERRRMVIFLRSQVPGLWNVEDNAVLDLVGGYPRVIARWIAEDARDTARTLEGLHRLAKESVEFRYSDLEKLLRDLDSDRRKLAIRIVLTPLVEDTEAWPVLQPIVTANLDPSLLDDLKQANILVRDSEPPRLGHPKRRDAARAFLDAHRSEAVKAEARHLILDLARSITSIDLGTIYYAVALRELQSVASKKHLGPMPLALCQAATMLFGERLESLTILLEGARQARILPEPGIGFLLAAVLFNTLAGAKAEDDLARRDALLDALRDLRLAYPDDAFVRGQLARSLANTLVAAKAEDDLARRDALLDELRDLRLAYPDDAPVREPLVKGLFNTLIGAKAEHDLARRNALLDELRDLRLAYPNDALVREPLVRGLLSTFNDARAEHDLARCGALFDELRALRLAYPKDRLVRKIVVYLPWD